MVSCEKRTVSVGAVHCVLTMCTRHSRCCAGLIVAAVVLWVMFVYGRLDEPLSISGKYAYVGINQLPQSIREYCVFAHDHQSKLHGNEGPPFSRTAVQLRAVLLVTRHGERSPIYVGSKSPSTQQRDCFLEEQSVNNTYNDLHRFIQSQGAAVPKVYGLHKDSSLNDLPPLSNRGLCEAGLMTAAGAVQHVQLGRYLRGRYKAVGMFAQDSKWTFVVYSTHYARTYQSALALLYGMLYDQSTTRMHPTPEIYTAPIEHFCGLYSTSESPVCTKKCLTKRKGLRLKELRDRLESLRVDHKDTHQLFVRLRDAVLGLSEQQMPAAIALFDYMMGRHACRQRQLPCGDKEQCAKWEDVDRLYKVIRNIESDLTETPAMRSLTLLEAHPVLHYLDAFINQNMTEDRHAKQFVYLSGHDVTLKPLIHSLGLFEGDIPKYRERLMFEVYEKEGKQLYLRVVWKGDDVTDRVTFCKGLVEKIDGLDLCPVSELGKWVNEGMLKEAGVEGIKGIEHFC